MASPLCNPFWMIRMSHTYTLLNGSPHEIIFFMIYDAGVFLQNGLGTPSVGRYE